MDITRSAYDPSSLGGTDTRGALTFLPEEGGSEDFIQLYINTYIYIFVCIYISMEVDVDTDIKGVMLSAS